MNISKIKLTNNAVANIKDATARAAIASFNATFAQRIHRHEYTDILDAPWTNDTKANTAYNKACDAYNASNTVSNMAQSHAEDVSVHVDSSLKDKWNNYASYINAATNIAHNACNIANNACNIANSPKEWTDILNKPESFNPSVHGHDWTEISNKPDFNNIEWNNISNKPSVFPPEYHVHNMSEVTQLQYTLNLMNNAINNAGTGRVDWNNVSNKPSEYPPESHTHLFTDVYSGGSINVPLNRTLDEFTNIINNKANVSHTHTKSQITDFPSIPTIDWNQLQISGNKIAEVTINGVSTDVYSPNEIPEWEEILNKPSNFPTNWALVEDRPTIARRNRHTIFVSDCSVSQMNEYGTAPASTSYKCVKVVTPDIDVQEGDLITLVWDNSVGTSSTYRNIYLQFGPTDTAKHWVLRYDGTDVSAYYATLGGARSSSSCKTNTFVYSSKLYSYGVLTWQNYWENTNYFIAICTTSATTASKGITTQYTQTLIDKLLVPVVFSSANTKASALTFSFGGNTFTVYINGTASSSSNYTIPRGLVWVYFDKNSLIAYVSSDGSLPNKYLTDKQSSLTIDWSQITNKPAVYDGGVV